MKIKNIELIISSITIALGTVILLLFHGIKGAGPLLLPMYYPVIISGFLISPYLAFITGLITPVMSTLLTGMPPINPPIVFMMCAELSILCWTISYLTRKFKINYYIILIVSLILNRIVYTFLLILFAHLFKLPVFSFAIIKLIAGWPGLLIIIIFLPGIAGYLTRRLNEVDIYAE